MAACFKNQILLHFEFFFFKFMFSTHFHQKKVRLKLFLGTFVIEFLAHKLEEILTYFRYSFQIY